MSFWHATAISQRISSVNVEKWSTIWHIMWSSMIWIMTCRIPRGLPDHNSRSTHDITNTSTLQTGKIACYCRWDYPTTNESVDEYHYRKISIPFLERISVSVGYIRLLPLWNIRLFIYAAFLNKWYLHIYTVVLATSSMKGSTTLL